MAKSVINLQDSFLNQVRKENVTIKIIMVHGETIEGQVRGFDNFTVIIASGGSQHMIYKHAIAQIVTDRPIGRRDDRESASQPRNREPRPQGKRKERPEPKKEGFNTLNLSHVVVSKDSEGG